jgi:hypothetical protein
MGPVAFRSRRRALLFLRPDCRPFARSVPPPARQQALAAILRIGAAAPPEARATTDALVFQTRTRSDPLWDAAARLRPVEDKYGAPGAPTNRGLGRAQLRRCSQIQVNMIFFSFTASLFVHRMDADYCCADKVRWFSAGFQQFVAILAMEVSAILSNHNWVCLWLEDSTAIF